jgi:hypothetical protein
MMKASTNQIFLERAGGWRVLRYIDLKRSSIVRE